MAQFVKTMVQFGSERPEWINLDYVVSIIDDGKRWALYLREDVSSDPGLGGGRSPDHYVAKKDLKLP